jgi:pimeloyl-ACP methyl ester carboxylesterase
VANYTSIRYTSNDGLALHARDYPTGGPAAAGTAAAGGDLNRLPVICIHGLTRNASDFDEFAPIVARQGRRVLALDVRGRGESQRDPNPDNYTPGVYAEDVVRLMADLNIPRAVFVGTSMGGLITMTLAAKHIDLIAAAVINDIGPVISEKGLARIAGYAGKTAAVDSWADAAGCIRDINACAFPDNADADWDKWARRAFAPDAAGRLAPRYDPNIAIALQIGKLRPTSLPLRMAFRKLTQERPVLLVRGTLSDLLEERQAAWMRRAAPRMTCVEVPNVGHAPMLTEPVALDAILKFLAQVP